MDAPKSLTSDVWMYIQDWQHHYNSSWWGVFGSIALPQTQTILFLAVKRQIQLPTLQYKPLLQVLLVHTSDVVLATRLQMIASVKLLLPLYKVVIWVRTLTETCAGSFQMFIWELLLWWWSSATVGQKKFKFTLNSWDLAGVWILDICHLGFHSVLDISRIRWWQGGVGGEIALRFGSSSYIHSLPSWEYQPPAPMRKYCENIFEGLSAKTKYWQDFFHWTYLKCYWADRWEALYKKLRGDDSTSFKFISIQLLARVVLITFGTFTMFILLKMCVWKE